jgi:hypothetical protein
MPVVLSIVADLYRNFGNVHSSLLSYLLSSPMVDIDVADGETFKTLITNVNFAKRAEREPRTVSHVFFNLSLLHPRLVQHCRHRRHRHHCHFHDANGTGQCTCFTRAQRRSLFVDDTHHHCSHNIHTIMIKRAQHSNKTQLSPATAGSVIATHARCDAFGSGHRLALAELGW